jgi:hypothetical protein
MRHGVMFLLSAILAGTIAHLPAATATMPVSELRPGMRGVGRTVFSGTELSEFGVEILGVLENVMMPQRQLVLARLSGGPLAETGVIAGMSGSPVYVDGRLVGAVSYSLGPFVKEPIAGITPIAEMTEATEPVDARPRLVAQWPARPDVAALSATLRAVFGGSRAFAASTSEVEGIGVARGDAVRLGLALRPIATPLVGSGFADVPLLADVLADAGFVPQFSAAGVAAPASPQPTTLRAGDPIGVSLVSGDLALGATGTVTLVEHDRVYAFGHPFFSLGPTAFPMTSAYVHTVLPSLANSVKLASLGTAIGTITQDRATAIAGTLGVAPPGLPISVTLEAERGLRKTFQYTVARDQLLTPLLTLVSLVTTLQSYERQAGAATFTIRGEARIRNHPSLALDDVFTGDPPSLGAAMYVVSPISTLLQNDRARVEVEAIDLTIASSEQPRTATIERVWLESARPRPGDTVNLKVVTRSYRGDEALRTLPIAIPSTAPPSVSIVVSDGPRLAQSEQRDPRRALQTQSIDRLITVLNGARRSNRVYVKLVATAPGAMLHGESMPSLPPSVLGVLEGDRQNGALRPLQTSTLGEWELAVDAMVTGTRTLTLDLDGR